jgi:hypothetical protein
MATYSTNDPTFTPTSTTQAPSDPTLQAALAAGVACLSGGGGVGDETWGQRLGGASAMSRARSETKFKKAHFFDYDKNLSVDLI